ncbi:MAG: hypothetical protein U1E65_01145 [Myxococcota bacterium]
MRRVAILASAEPWLSPICGALVSAGHQVIVVGDGRIPAGVKHIPGPIHSTEEIRLRLEALGDVDAFIVHPAPTPGAEPAPPIKGAVSAAAMRRATAFLEDDALWEASLEHALAMPWRWLRACFSLALRRSEGSITMLIPGAPRPDLQIPEEIAWRDALATFVQVSAGHMIETKVRINGVFVAPQSYPEDLAQLCTTLVEGGGIQGQMLVARARLPQ